MSTVFIFNPKKVRKRQGSIHLSSVNEILRALSVANKIS